MDRLETMVDDAFRDLMANLRPGTTEENKARIEKAFHLANEAHAGVVRKSGEPYILHPIAVAKICATEIGLGTTSVIAALLHDVVEDTDRTVDDIAAVFDPKVAALVDGLTKISEVLGDESSKQAETFRKIILTMIDDVRVIYIKIADRLHNMRTLSALSERKQVKIASETLYIYAPLAYRLGLHAIKTELEDLSLKYENPEQYEDLQKRITDYRNRNSESFETFVTELRKLLTRNGINFQIMARTKSVYSVWAKMKQRQIPFEEVYDLVAVRIIFEPREDYSEAAQCWQIFSLIVGDWSIKDDRTRDWVNTPKANGYEALHLTVMGPNGHWIEVQIRTTRMNDIAEKGMAIHRRYKGDKDADTMLDKWLADLKRTIEDTQGDALDFLDEFKLNLYAKEIRVFTPKGDLVLLPKGATVLDFAYDIHSEIGNHCIGAKINHKLVPVQERLVNGDQIEILTSDKQNPTRDWLQWVATARARSYIKSAVKTEENELIWQGQQIFTKIYSEIPLLTEEEAIHKATDYYKVTVNDLMIHIAKKDLDNEQLKKVLKRRSRSKSLRFWNIESGATVISDLGGEQSDFTIASCCHPIPGDEVVGVKTDQGLVVHKRYCPESIKTASSHGDRLVSVKWVSHQVNSFLAVIKLSGVDRVGIVNDVTNVITKELNVNIRMIHFETKDRIFEGVIHLYVYDTSNLNNLILKIASIKGVGTISRVEEGDF